MFEFFRNDALDARNFFNFTSSQPPAFKRNQFGVAVGGPLVLPRFGRADPLEATTAGTGPSSFLPMKDFDNDKE
jgi:hypothetical protein